MFIRPQPYTCLGIECAVSRRSSDTHTRFSVRTVARQTRGRRARRRGAAAEPAGMINESEFTGGVMAYAMAPRTCVIHPALRPWRPGIRPGYRLEIRTSGFRVPVIRLPAYLAGSRRLAPVRRDRYRDGLTPDVRRGLSRVSYPVGSLPVRTLRPLTDHRRDDVLAHPRTPSITPSITPSTLTPVPPRVYDAPEPRRRSHASCERRGRLCHRLDEDFGVAFGLEIAHTDARAEQ